MVAGLCWTSDGGWHRCQLRAACLSSITKIFTLKPRYGPTLQSGKTGTRDRATCVTPSRLGWLLHPLERGLPCLRRGRRLAALRWPPSMSAYNDMHLDEPRLQGCPGPQSTTSHGGGKHRHQDDAYAQRGDTNIIRQKGGTIGPAVLYTTTPEFTQMDWEFKGQSSRVRNYSAW